MRKILTRMCRAALLALLLAPAAGRAQQTAAPDTALSAAMQDTSDTPAVDENAASARIFMKNIEVLGTIAKPQALFIIPGRDPKVDGIEIDRSFFRDIFRPVEKDYHPQNTRRYLKDQTLW
ncbi:MAG: hypothetical protein ONB48_03930 [candidate division KSB1 bacterium]|nr:hypothetical protein [candidate division KSB1 bacterium]MDZ7274540.1 hypothetical protein [candidate division KSB1 bacterium]MDZ7284799.1 hypothetical protein [candidate division KSB1 bacterium]MDZ7297781.1 hypothetical protein [candidate division KSB1 bacterium]MDZ7306430.1 hypothetical protein [candidate division KSB1 bacterium]